MARNPNKPVQPTKKHLARQERERRQTRVIMTISAIVLVLVIALVAFGIIDQQVLKPRETVAVVNGTKIRADHFEGQVRYARYNTIQQATQLYQFMQLFGSDPSTMGSFVQQLQQIQFQLSPSILGQQVLDNMVDNELIRQEAARRGISLSEEEREKAFQEAFRFFPGGTPTPTPTLEAVATSTLSALQQTLVPPTPTLAPTQALTETQSLTETVGLTETVDLTATATTTATVSTPTPSAPVTPTATLAPTLTATPYTEAGYEELRQTTLDNFKTEFGITPQTIQYVLETQLLREKVMDAILSEMSVERMQDQVWLRHISTPTEEAANQISENIKGGADFVAQASIANQDPATQASGGDLGWLSKESLTSQYGEGVANQAFELEIGAISEPITTTTGTYEIIQVLGHETRALSGEELQSLREQKFQEWLTEQRTTATIETMDVWVNHVPTEPELPPEIQQVIQQSLQPQPTQPVELSLPTSEVPQPTAQQ